MLQHIPHSEEQEQELLTIVNTLNQGERLLLNIYLPDARSYTLRNNLLDCLNGIPFTKYTLNFLSSISPEVLYPILTDLLQISDRGGTDRADPINNHRGVKLAYIPKGLTDFNPGTKLLNEELTGSIHRRIIRQNQSDPTCPESDKAITIKVYGNESVTNNFLHIYFNKYSEVTLKRLILIGLELAYKNLDRTKLFGEDKEAIDAIVENLCDPKEDSANKILESIRVVMANFLKAEEKDLIKNFARITQKSLNTVRREQVNRDKNNAELNYANALDALTRYATLLKNAQQELINYSEVDFSSIEVFLEKIKNHPNTKDFRKISADYLQFVIEEPIIYTEEKVWSKYLTNRWSDTRQSIEAFAKDYYKTYKTTAAILDFCIQRLFKEVLVDRKIKLFTASAMYLDQKNPYFQLRKNSLPGNTGLFPHPHLGTGSLTCWGNAMTEIVKAINANDGETAFLQMMYAFQQMTATDNIVVRKLTECILDTAYDGYPIYQKDEEKERKTFKNIIKEFIEDETNKINAPSDTSSEVPF